MWDLYIIKSLKVKRYYIGVTENIIRRLEQHNSGNSKSTKPYRPWIMVYSEKYLNKKEAFKREFYLKHPKGYKDKLRIIKESSGEVA